MTDDRKSAPTESYQPPVHSVDEILAAYEMGLDDAPPANSAELNSRRESLLADHPAHADVLRKHFANVDQQLNLGSEDSLEGATLPAGYRFGDYEIREFIAAGGMGIIYRAHQLSADREVAIKMIRQELLPSQRARARFRLEARTVARLSHPGIVALHEVGEHAGRPYFSMDYLPLRSLDQRLKEGRFAPRDAARLMVKIAAAVEHAHEHGVLHRDLKPSNVLVDQHNEPKVTDFGLAKQLDVASELTQEGYEPGTYRYMSPEQIEGRSGEVTTRTDIYALGVVLFELLTGQLPFQGHTTGEVREAILHAEPQWPAGLRADLPIDLVAICLKCLEKDPAARYGRAAELAEDLTNYLEGLPVSARTPTWLERSLGWCRRNPIVAGLSTAVALSLGLAVGAVLYAYLQSAADLAKVTEQRNRADFLTYSAQVGAAMQAFSAGDLVEAKRMLDSCGVENRGWEHRLLERGIAERVSRFPLDQPPLASGDKIFHTWLDNGLKSISLSPQKIGESPRVTLSERSLDERKTLVWKTSRTFRALSRLQTEAVSRNQWERIQGLHLSANGRRLILSIRELNRPLGTDFCWTTPDVGHVIAWKTTIEGPPLIVRDPAIGKPNVPAQPERSDPVVLAWNPTGEWIMGALRNGSLVTYDPDSRQEVLVHEEKVSGDLNCQLFISGNRVILIAVERIDPLAPKFETYNFPIEVKVFESAAEMQIAHGAPLKVTGSYRVINRSEYPPVAQVSPNGSKLALATKDGQLCILSFANEQRWDGRVTGEATSLAFDDQEESLAVGDSSGAVTIWRQDSADQDFNWIGEPRQRVSKGPIEHLAHGASDIQCLSSFENEILKMPSATPSFARRIGDAGFPIAWKDPFQLTLRGRELLSWTWDFQRDSKVEGPNLGQKGCFVPSTGEVWEVQRADGEGNLQLRKTKPNGVSNLVVFEKFDRRWEQHPALMIWEPGEWENVAIAPRSGRVAELGSWQGGWIVIWDAASGTGLHRIPPPEVYDEWPTCCALGGDENRLFVGLVNGEIRTLDMTAGKWIERFRVADAPIARIRLADDGNTFCATVWGKSVKFPSKGDETAIIDIASMKPTETFRGVVGTLAEKKIRVSIPLTPRGAEFSALSHDGSRFFTSPKIGQISIFDTTYGRELGELTYPFQLPVPAEGQARASKLEIGPDDQVLMIGDHDEQSAFVFYWRADLWKSPTFLRKNAGNERSDGGTPNPFAGGEAGP